MKGAVIEELGFEEDYKALNAELAEKNAAYDSEPHIPLNPQKFIDDATRRAAEARAALHVKSETTESVLARLDELLLS